MAKHTISGFLVHEKYEWEDEARIVFLMYEPSGSVDRVSICPHSIEVETPDDFDPTPKKVAALVAKKAEVRAELTKQVTELDAQINKLLCLEMA